jgi:TPP-dependent pyruvate/acetoin dehydrogenase alpha subunit
MEQEIRADIDAAVAFAQDSPAPDPSELAQHVYGPRK